MYLHENKKVFKQIINDTSLYFRLPTTVILKDYYTFLVLKELNKKIPGLVFKGGTSLSRCLKIIKRFSEDIDLTLSEGYGNQANRKRMVKSIKEICENMGLELTNPEDIKSGLSYNCFELSFTKDKVDTYLRDYIKVEAVFMTLSYPCEYKEATCYIGDYLKSLNLEEKAKEFELDPFNIQVQAIERTFIDKVFAICDYYEKNLPERNSRHIYDLYKLCPLINFDDNFSKLITRVRDDRSKRKNCISAAPNYCINKTLNLIAESEFYKEDYDTNMYYMLQEDITYEDSISVIQKIIELNIF